MKNLKKLGKLKLMPEKLLNHEELVSFSGGSGQSHMDYCATQFAIISRNPGTSAFYFNSNGCNNGTNGPTYWGHAVSLGIPMNQTDCNIGWYG